MLRRIFQPEILFLLGTLQALLPYLFWANEETDLNYVFHISGMPFWIYTLGFLAFYCGVILVPRIRMSTNFAYLDRLDISRLTFLIAILCAVLLVQVGQMIRIYGGIPLLAFLSQQMDVNEANESLEDSSLGQMAMLQLTLLSLNAMVMVHAMIKLRTGNFRWLCWEFALAMPLMLLGFTMGGKRQGLFMAFFFCITGAMLYGPRWLNLLLSKLMIRGKAMRLALYIGAPLIGLLLFQFIGMMRSGREASLGLRESLFYLELPLINLEYQCELIGYGPDVFAPEGLLRFLLPRRLHLVMPGDLLRLDWPLRLEPTASAGFYGELHWHVGLLSALLFAFGAGWISQYTFSRAENSLLALLAYCQIAWTLLACHSYNHFLTLVFIPLPVFAYTLLAVTLQTYRKNRYEFPTTLAQSKPSLQLQSSRTR